MSKLVRPRSMPSRPRAMAGAYEGASSTIEGLSTWLPSFGSADEDLLGDLAMLRARNRDLSNNNGIASSAIQTITDNVVGTGLRLSAKPDYQALGRDKAWADVTGRRIEALWRSWADGTDCDAGRTLNFAGLTQLAFRSGLLNGEALALPLWLPGRGAFATRIQLIEADRLSKPPHIMDGAGMRDGIEIDRHGAPRAYWIRKTHPGDSYVYGASPDEWRRVRAETRWGRRRVIHAFNRERPGQNRGKPLFAPVVKQFKMLEKYQSSELQAAVINAMIAAFVETPMGAEDIAEMFGGGKDNFEQYVEDRAKFTENRVSLKAGAVLPMFPGDKVNPFTPTRPSDAFAPFVDAMNRHVATALNIPYELLLKDFSKTNYSSARAALLEAWRFFNGRRKWLSDSWAQPVYELWLEEAVGTGLVDLPDYYANHRAYARADWIGPGRGWVDPAKEAKAAQMRLDTGVSTLERECAEQGLDWQEVLQQRALEREYMRELGLLEAADAGALAPFPIESEDDNQQKPDGAGS